MVLGSGAVRQFIAKRTALLHAISSGAFVHKYLKSMILWQNNLERPTLVGQDVTRFSVKGVLG